MRTPRGQSSHNDVKTQRINRRALLKRFQDKNVLIDPLSVPSQQLERVKEQLSCHAKGCKLVNCLKDADCLLTTKKSVKGSRSLLKQEQKTEKKQKVTYARTNSRLLKLQKNVLDLNSDSKESSVMSITKEWLKSKPSSSIILYDDIEASMDQFWPPASEDPDKYRFQEPTNGVNCYVSDHYGLYKLVPHHMLKMPTLPKPEEIPGDFPTGISPFQFQHRLENGKDVKPQRKKKKSRKPREQKAVHCDVCERRVLNYNDHEENDKTHKEKVAKANFDAFDEIIKDKNDTWIDCIRKTKQTMEKVEKMYQKIINRKVPLNREGIVWTGENAKEILSVLKGEKDVKNLNNERVSTPIDGSNMLVEYQTPHDPESPASDMRNLLCLQRKIRTLKVRTEKIRE